MSMSVAEKECQSPLYAVIDLGSNSFHMLITRQLANSVQVVDKVKRKVRLASGLNAKNELSDAAIARGLECLSFFAERLQDIPKDNVRLVATATLRLAINRADFLKPANAILGQKIQLLTGLEEAEHIFLGVAHTSCGASKRLVFDIGGASTEIIVGDGFKSQRVTSLDMGCVTFNQQYFSNQLLNESNFQSAINTAKASIEPLIADYQQYSWDIALGGSGTMQALAEMLLHSHKPSIISLSFLYEVKAQLVTFQRVDLIDIPGLTSERTPVIAPGLAILIALFESFSVEQLQLSSGALREGLLYEMLPDTRKVNIRQRTINALAQRFHIDELHSSRVKCQVNNLYAQYASYWNLKQDNGLALLNASCDLHEIGLLMEFKRHQEHSAYILKNADLPGFDQADRQLLVALVKLYKGDIDIKLLSEQSAISYKTACYLLAILRLAVILCRRRTDDVLPEYQTSITDKTITLSLPTLWLANHPLIGDELLQENEQLQRVGLALHIYRDDLTHQA